LLALPAQYADDLSQFVEQMGLQRFTLVGHSMGGGVCMQYAVQHQDRLKALVLVDPLAPFGTQIPPDITAWINAQQGNAEGLRPLVLGAFATPPTGAYLEQLVDDAARWNQAIYLGTMDDMARFHVSARPPSSPGAIRTRWSRLQASRRSSARSPAARWKSGMAWAIPGRLRFQNASRRC